MTAATQFESWWTEFCREGDALSDPHEAARHIGRHLRSLPPDEQPAFVDELFEALLQQEHRYGVALYMLEQVTDPNALVTLARRLQPLPSLRSEDEEGHLADLIRILAVAGEPEMMDVVRSYVLKRPIGPHWSSVPWALWPYRRDLFGAAWTRFFRERPRSASESTLLIRSFLTEPDAIGDVRRGLAETAPEAWDALRAALLRQAGTVRWLDAAQREALERSLQ